MNDRRTERKLAAILAADVAGYSRLMGDDEEGTLRRLNAHLAELVRPVIEEHRGRVVKRTGDGLLVDFASAVEAVRCAIAIQAGMEGRIGGEPEETRIEFRIGINLGDVIIDGDDIYGDGVNIAARLEGIAEPGAIFVSRAVRDSVRDKLEFVLEDLGERPVKNIVKPVRVFRIAGTGRATGPRVAPPPPVQQKPSIAVLPFTNMSGDAEQEYFSDGMTEDLITDLSKVSGLFVIARNSSFTYKGKAARVQDIGRDLGARYVLEGSIRRAGGRVRITAQLIDAQSGGHLWAERFDRNLTDIFATQDEVVREIVAALEVNLTRGEEQRLRHRDTSNVEAYEFWWRARELLGQGTRNSALQAAAMHRRAIELDPTFAAPHAGLAFVALAGYINGWAADAAQALDEAEASARRAIALNDQAPVGHMALGTTFLWRRDHDAALAELRRAIELDPNYAQGHVGLGLALMYAGRAAESLEQLNQARRLDPHHSNMLFHMLAQSRFSLRHYEAAAELLVERIARNPNTDASRMLLAASYGQLGRIDEARAVWADLLKVNPEFSVTQRERVLPYKDAGDFRLIVEGLAKAGLP